jgi:hypothetical protein
MIYNLAIIFDLWTHLPGSTKGSSGVDLPSQPLMVMKALPSKSASLWLAVVIETVYPFRACKLQIA